MRGLLTRLGVQTAFIASIAIVIIAVVVSWQLNRLIERREHDHYESTMTHARAQLEQQVTTLLAIETAAATTFANSEEARAALTTGNMAALFTRVTTVGSALGGPSRGAPGLQLYDSSGRLLARAHNPFNVRQATVPPEVQRASATRQSVSGARIDELMGMSFTGIAPIIGNDGAALGAIEILSGTNQSYLIGQSDAIGAVTALVRPGILTIASESEFALDLAGLNTDTITQATAGPIELGSGTARYLATLSPIVSAGGAPLGYWFVGIEHERVHAGTVAVQRQVNRAVIAAVVVAIVGAWVLSYLVVRPLEILSRAARRIQLNDLESAVPITGPMEIQRLGEALDDMRIALRMSREGLLDVNRSLAEQYRHSSMTLTEMSEDLRVIQRVLSHLTGDSGGGLPGTVDELTSLPWIDGALIAVATEDRSLSVAARSNLTPETAATLVEHVVPALGDAGSRSELIVTDTRVTAETSHLAAWGVGGIVALPMLAADGIVGLLGITSTGTFAATRERIDLLRAIARETGATLERTELADEVEENRRIAESALREMSDGVLVLNSEGVCRICNPAAARLLNRPRAEIVGRAAEVFLPVSNSEMQTLHRRAKEPGDLPVSPVVTAVAGRQLAISSGPFADPDPTRSGLLILVRDLSAEAEAERVKQDFVSMVGHELRTPLTLIRTTTDLLYEGDAGQLNETQERIVGVLRGNSDRLMSLINDLLDMSALDSGRMQINPATVDLGEIVAETVRASMPQAQAKEHLLLVDAPTGVSVWADRTRIEQVLSNLIGNAIKYTPTGGRIEVTLHERVSTAEVSVRDSGVGIPPEEQGRLFEKFYRTVAGRRVTGGTGLGLAIARSLVELHGGTIRCESDGHTGSIFTFTLPLRRV